MKNFVLRRMARLGFVRPFNLYSAAAWYLKDRQVGGIVDGGAYDGTHAQFLSQLFPKALIFAFEPLQTRFQDLTAISVRNSRIIPVNVALSDSVGKATLNYNVLDSTSSLL